MRVAFDVQGTLEGRNQDKVRALFQWFAAKGAALTVWSNGMRMDVLSLELQKEFGIESDAMWKKTKSDVLWDDDNEESFFDIAVDDDTQQTWLAAKNFIWVHEIPEDSTQFDKKYGHFFTQENDNG